VSQEDKDAAILAQKASGSPFPYVIPSLAYNRCEGAKNDSTSQPVLAIQKSDFDSFNTRSSCAKTQVFDNGTGSGCGRCLDGKWSWKSGDTVSISLLLWGSGSVTVTAGTETSPANLSNTVTNIPLGSLDERTPIEISVTGAAPYVYGYLQGTLPNQTSYNLPLEKFLVRDTITNSFPKSGLPQTFNGVSLRKLIPGNGKKSMKLTGPLPLTFIQSEDFAAFDCPSSPLITKQESWAEMNAGTDPCMNPLGQGPGNYDDKCLQPLILKAGCSSSGNWFSDPSTYAKSMSIGQFTSWLTTNIALAANNSAASYGCYGRDVATPCDAYLNNSAIPNVQCLTYLYNNSGANIQSVGSSYPGAKSSGTFCSASGTLNPSNKSTEKAALAELTSMAAGYNGARGIEAVKKYLADIYNKATGNLDINAPDSAGGRNTSRVKCFGDVAMYSPPVLTEGATYECAGTSRKYRAIGGKLCWFPSPEIATSWDPNWKTNYITIRCDYGGFVFGPDMAMKPQVLIEGATYVCRTNTGQKFRAVNGKLCSYPSPDIATSWDPNWNNPSMYKTIDCNGVSYGPVMAMKPPPDQWAYGNNGSVSCETYCKGVGGGPWNNELPAAWNGAKCVATDNPAYGCSVAPGMIRGPYSSALGCKCQKTGTGWVGPIKPVVRIYYDYNLKGPYTEIGPGMYSLSQMMALPNFRNDSASSIEVGPGIKSVTLFADDINTRPSYQLTLTATANDLRIVYFDNTPKWNADKTLSSFIVR